MFLRHLTFVATFIGAIVLNPGLAHSASAPKCTGIFLDATVQARPVDFGLRGSFKNVTPHELLKFQETKTELWRTLKTLPEKRQSEIEHLLAAVEFFDYAHTADKLLTNFFDGKKERFDFSTVYDAPMYGEAKAAPFKGFLNARDKFLRVQQPPVTADLLLDIHRYIMDGKVEGITPDQLGALREVALIGNVAGNAKITPREKEAILENRYLDFEESARDSGSLMQNLWSKIRIWGSKKDMLLAPQDNTLISGKIKYPSLRSTKEATFEIIKDSHPDLYRQIRIYKESNGQIGAAPKESDLVRALLEERFARFNADRAAMGQIKVGVNEQAYIDLVADFQRDIVAIHPLRNGNGRTTRLFMNYLLTKEGLPPVRLVDPYLDVQVPKEEWRQYVHKGVVNSAQLQADILFRIKNDLTVEYSPELLYPGLPEMVGISLKKHGSAKEVPNYALTKVESEQFSAFIKTLVQIHPELRQEIKNDRIRAMSRIADLFVEFYRSKTIRFIHEKDGEREIGLRLVDTEFVELFGVNHSYSKELWDAKINRWYDSNQLIWRGLSNRHSEHTREDLLGYFVKPSTHLASNSVVRAATRGVPLKQAIKNDFELYNKETLTGDVVQMAIDHHRTGPRYGESYGYSTSKREVVGKAFAMGAMVVGKYGEHTDPAMQEKLKSRVNVASYRAMKDVDLGRLKAFDPDFSYIYGRQAEIMGIGGTDPDAVMLIQRIDAKGAVIETLLRNVDKPDEILVIRGRYVPGEGPLPTDKIIERVTIPKAIP